MLVYVDNPALGALGKKKFKKLVKKVTKVAVAPVKKLVVKPIKQAAKSKTVRKVAKVAAAGALVYYGGPAAGRLLQMRRRGGGAPGAPEMSPEPMIPNAEPSMLPESYTPPVYLPPAAPRAMSYGPSPAAPAILPDDGETITTPAQGPDLATMLTPQNVLIGSLFFGLVLMANRRQ